MIKNKDSLIIILSGVLWGFVGLVTTQIFSFNFTETEVVELRFLISAIVMLVILLLFNRNLLKPKNIWICLLLGLSNFFTCVCYYKAIKYLGGGVACVLLYSSPIFVVIYCKIAYNKRITKKTYMAMIFCLLGSILSANSKITINFKGLIYGLLSAFFNSLVSIVGARANKVNGAITATTYGFMSSSVVGLIYIRLNTFTRLYNVKVNYLFLLLSVGCTIIPYLLYFSAIKTGQEGKASLLCVSEPITANLIEIFINKKINIFSIIGLILLIVGIFFIYEKNTNYKGEKIDKQNKQRSFRNFAKFYHRN